jgi:DNA-binding transcriptional MerR regulator
MMRHAEQSAVDQKRAANTARAGDEHAPAAAAADTSAETLMTIGEIAREFGMTLRALRFYEAKRLIKPERHGAVRLYGRRDRERISLILTGRRLGFTLAEIRELVGKPEGDGLHLTRQQCVEQINLLEQQKRGLEIAIAELRQIYSSFYQKLLDEAAPRRNAAG